MAWNKPLPDVDEDMAPFWKALKQHQFSLFRCQKCGAWYWPAAYCRFHDDEPFMGNMKWTPSSGKGKVFSFNIHYRPFHPGFRSDVPYALALIELDEGPMFGTQVIGCDVKDVYIGMPVEIVFEDITEEFTLPKFRPITGNP